tara:strand:+ start:289 stop:606 length:318 start_codon:yes stop_codon:yes gene_type:complete
VTISRRDESRIARQRPKKEKGEAAMAAPPPPSAALILSKKGARAESFLDYLPGFFAGSLPGISLAGLPGQYSSGRLPVLFFAQLLMQPFCCLALHTGRLSPEADL